MLSFDAVEEYGLPDFDELVSYYEELYRSGQGERGDAVFPGGYYRTLVSGAIGAFGWERLLEAAAYQKEFERVLKEAGKRVLFCCDGQWTESLADAAEAGADGFIFEPLTSFDVAAEKFGGSHVLVGSKVDCRTLTFGSPEQIRAESTLEGRFQH
ncbi:MAG: hypothetical protein GWP05_09320 [Anaerolineaceae bacterium]|nr:hypothetical protein [Anaerolineaceae bacterium]